MPLLARIEDSETHIDDISAFLDGLGARERWLELSHLSRNAQRRLYEKAAKAPTITAEHFHRGSALGAAIVHEGLNTLPVLRPFRRFQKCFTRVEGDDCLYGYNEGITRPFIGPGYFVAVMTEGRPQWESRGGIVVDYYQVPPGGVPSAWPKLRPNSSGLQRFVFKNTRDYMRRVSEHVSVGAAYKNGRPLDHYFILCCRD